MQITPLMKNRILVVLLLISGINTVFAQETAVLNNPQQSSDVTPTPMVFSTPVQSSSTPNPALPSESNSEAIPAAPLTPVPAKPCVVPAHPSLIVVPPGIKPLTFTESQQVMLDSAPPSKPASAESTEAFNGLLQQNMPLTPQQVVRLRQMIDVSQRAAAIPANVPPKPVSSTLMVNLAPGATPSAIRLAQGYVSSLVFVDSTGSPWPIASYDVGDPKANTIQWDGKSNILLIQAIAPYSDSNIVIRLIGLATPVTLELVSGQRVVDYRADIHVSGIGPNSKDIPSGTRLPDSASQLLLGVLDGVAPPGSKQLSVRGGDAQVWLLGDKMYLRTRFTVLSPGWVGKMVSPDGMNAYEIQTTSSILISQYGEPVELKVGGL